MSAEYGEFYDTGAAAAGFESLEKRVIDEGFDLEYRLNEKIAWNGQLLNRDLDDAIPYLRARYTNVLAEVLTDSTPDVATQEAAYNAFHFVGRVLTALYNRPVAPVLNEDYFDGKKSKDELRRDFDITAWVYLARNPALDGLVGRYLSYLDQSGNHYKLVKAVCGLLLHDTEEEERQRFATAAREAKIDAEVAAFARELEAWPETPSAER
ncbi:MAG TPA: hypothetical protein VHD60_03390 [Candidatus Saccharimonadales bacterium]|nr:hypothetical protein [Candidatus Saccharimonadales bacterium]